MKVCCVSESDRIHPTAEIVQGVCLTGDMLEKGIWERSPRSDIRDADIPEKFQSTLQLFRAEREKEYRAALRALILVFQKENKYHAVVSLRWCSFSERLVVSNMVHLEIFDGEQSVCRFCRADFKVVPSFIDCWKEPSISIGEWHKRFATAIVESESRNRLRGEIAHLA